MAKTALDYLVLSLNSFWAAMEFLTIFPVPVQHRFSDKEVEFSVAFFPVVGLLLGVLLASLDYGLSVLVPSGVAVVLVLIAWVITTGALHWDGFLDSCDALGGHSSDERMKILHDERAGSYAVLGGVLLFALMFAALQSTPQPTYALMLAPMIGRWTMSLAVLVYPYGRNSGLGLEIRTHANKYQAIAVTVFTVLVAIILQGWLGLLAATLALILGWAICLFALTRLPGLTGDVYGAVAVLSEATVLVVLSRAALTAAASPPAPTAATLLVFFPFR